MANRLAGETSPYLLQHADNPVDWYPWGEDAIADAYREQRDEVARQSAALVDALRRTAELQPSREPLTEGLLEEAQRGMLQQLDPRWGGFGRAPKFPPASALEFLLRRGELG